MKLSQRIAHRFHAIPFRTATWILAFIQPRHGGSPAVPSSGPSRVNPTRTSAMGNVFHGLRSGSVTWLLGLVVMVRVATGLLAQEQVVVPELVNYQGRLESLQAGKSYLDELYTLEFRIWDTATSTNSGLLWAESYSVYVKNGNFNVVLGDDSGSPLKNPLQPQSRSLREVFRTASAHTDRFLGITVKQDEAHAPISNPLECRPRQQMLSAPFAFQAQYAQYANSAGANSFYATNGIMVSGSPLTASEVVQCNKGLTVSGAKADLQNGLQVAGAATFSGSLVVNGGPMDVYGRTTLHGNVDLTACTTTSGGFVPLRGIIMFSGTEAPPGWALCNGDVINGIKTPDLRGRFVLASGKGTDLTVRPLDKTGGQEKVTLKVEQIPKHTHDLSVKTFQYSAVRAKGDRDVAGPDYKAADTHNSFTTKEQNLTVEETKGDPAHENMPPYYVLAFIMRVQ